MITEGTAIIKIGIGQDEAVQALAAEVSKLLAFAESRTIANNEDVKWATEDLSFIAQVKKSLEEKRKEYVNPINALVSEVNGTFKGFTGPLEQADRVLRDKILAYHRDEERKAREIEEINRLRMEAARREAAMNDGEISESVELIEKPDAPPSTVRTEVGTLGTMKVTKWEVEDFSKVPDDYKVIDAAKVGKVVRAGIPSIPGIRIWKEDTLKVNTGG